MKILINGKAQDWTANVVAHKDVTRIAGASDGATVAVRVPGHPARVLPVGAVVATIEGTDFTTTPAPPKPFTVNGTAEQTSELTLSYEQVLELAGETAGATVVFHAMNDEGWEKSGTLSRGQSVRVYPGMSFDAVHTGSA